MTEQKKLSDFLKYLGDFKTRVDQIDIGAYHSSPDDLKISRELISEFNVHYQKAQALASSEKEQG